MRPAILFPLLILATLAALIFSLLTGSVATDYNTLLSVITGENETVIRQIILELRWPRAAAAFADDGARQHRLDAAPSTTWCISWRGAKASSSRIRSARAPAR